MRDPDLHEDACAKAVSNIATATFNIKFTSICHLVHKPFSVQQ